MLFGSLLSLSEISISQSRLQAYHLLSGRRGSAALRCAPELPGKARETVVFVCTLYRQRLKVSLSLFLQLRKANSAQENSVFLLAFARSEQIFSIFSLH